MSARRHLHSYNTGAKKHRKQLAFHRCDRRNRWVFGGNRTGKTECGAVETVWHARGIHPYRRIGRATTGWVVSLTYEVQRDVAQQKILSYLPQEWIAHIVMRKGGRGAADGGVIDYIDVYSVWGGTSRIAFKSCDQGRTKFQGTSLDYVWFDEEPPEDIYLECRMRVLDKSGDIWGTMTPLLGMTWVYDTIFRNVLADDQVWSCRMTWQDNPFLPAEEAERMAAAMSREERDVRVLGHFAAGGRLVYPEFDEQIHVIEPFDVPRHWMDRISIDPGLANPLSCHFYACDEEGTVYVVAEHYQRGMTVEQHARAIFAIAQRLHWPTDGAGRLLALFDPAVHARTLAAEKSAAELFAGHGILPQKPYGRDRWTGIQKVREYLRLREAQDTAAWPRGKPRLFIFSSCVKMIEEMRRYRYNDTGEEPRKVADHAMDELRYYIMSRPENARAPKREESEIERDKRMLGYGLRRPGGW